MVEEEAQVGKELAITVSGIYLALVTYFKYIGRILPTADENWPEVVNNLWRARQKWAQLTRVLGR